MPDDLDKLFKSAAIEPPPQFVQNVMGRVAQMPPVAVSSAPSRVDKLEWLGLSTAFVASWMPLLSYMFGIWRTAVAG